MEKGKTFEMLHGSDWGNATKKLCNLEKYVESPAPFFQVQFIWDRQGLKTMEKILGLDSMCLNHFLAYMLTVWSGNIAVSHL